MNPAVLICNTICIYLPAAKNNKYFEFSVVLILILTKLNQFAKLFFSVSCFRRLYCNEQWLHHNDKIRVDVSFKKSELKRMTSGPMLTLNDGSKTSGGYSEPYNE